MDKTLIALTIFYFIPVVLSFILSYLDEYTETIEDLMKHFWICIVPGLNIMFIVFVIIHGIFESDKWGKLSVFIRTKWVKFKNIKIKK